MQIYVWDGLYKGETKDGRPDGIGIWISNQGNKYIGEWINGRMNGMGVWEYSYGYK
jgi:hypothetical protein